MRCVLMTALGMPVEPLVNMIVASRDSGPRAAEKNAYTGYSALSMAAGLPADGELITCDIDKDTNAIARSFWARSPHGGKIKPILGPALETIRALPANTPFDFVFIDADKENYVNYYEAIIPRVKSGGLIAADNTLWSGKVLEPKEKSDHAIVSFNAHVTHDVRVENALLSVRDGVMLVRKR